MEKIQQQLLHRLAKNPAQRLPIRSDLSAIAGGRGRLAPRSDPVRFEVQNGDPVFLHEAAIHHPLQQQLLTGQVLLQDPAICQNRELKLPQHILAPLQPLSQLCPEEVPNPLAVHRPGLAGGQEAFRQQPA